MRIAPFEGSEAEHGNVQHIGFAGVDAGSLLWCDFCRDKVLFDSIGVDAVIYFRQFSLGTPAQLRGGRPLRPTARAARPLSLGKGQPPLLQNRISYYTYYYIYLQN